MNNSTTRILILLVFVLGIGCAVALTLVLAKPHAPATQVATATTATGSSTTGTPSEEAVKSIIDAYLEEHPEVIVNAFTKARAAQYEKEQKDAEKNITEKLDELEHDPATPFAGNAKGDVAVVQFSDYNCGYCKHVTPDIIALLKEDKNVKFVQKDFPILGERSIVNARAGIAFFALKPEKWFEFHKALMEDTPQTDDQLNALVQNLGVDVATFKEELAKPKYQEKIQQNLQLGQDIGVRGTPAFVIGGEFIRGAADLQTLQAKVAAAREKKKG